MQRIVIIPYWRFGTYSGKKIRKFFLALDDGTEHSANNYHYTLCNVPEERRSGSDLFEKEKNPFPFLDS